MNRSFINCYMVSTISSSPIHLGVPNHLPTEHEDLASQSKRFGQVGRLGVFSNSTGGGFSRKILTFWLRWTKWRKCWKFQKSVQTIFEQKHTKKKHVSSTDLGEEFFRNLHSVKIIFFQRDNSPQIHFLAKRLLHLSQACLRNHVAKQQGNQGISPKTWARRGRRKWDSEWLDVSQIPLTSLKHV